RISRSRASEDYSDSSCGGEDNGARPDHHRNNSSTRSGGALVCRAHRFYHPARVEKSAKVVLGSTLATVRARSVLIGLARSARRGLFSSAGVQKPDHWHRRLLRARREGPSRCAAEQRYERAPLHSITSSALACSVSGTARLAPSRF